MRRFIAAGSVCGCAMTAAAARSARMSISHVSQRSGCQPSTSDVNTRAWSSRNAAISFATSEWCSNVRPERGTLAKYERNGLT